MRSLKADDEWRALKKRSLQAHLSEVILSIPNLLQGTIKINGAITIITGLNGVGKSTLLHALYLLLQGSKNNIELASLKNCRGTIKGKLKEDSNNFTEIEIFFQNGVTFSNPPKPNINTVWINPSFEVPELIREFRNEDNLKEFLDQFTPKELDAIELQFASQIIGKEYSLCQQYELDGVNDNTNTTRPYFRVRSLGIDYGTEEMGLGEASLHYIMWHLNHMPENSIILIEEPETYISLQSQDALMNFIAHKCLEKKSSAIITTHSSHIFSEISPEHTIILVKNDGPVPKAITVDSCDSRLVALGVQPIIEKQGVILVEDNLASIFTSILICHFEPILLNKWRIINARSNGLIIKALEYFPKLGEWFKVIGLLDGDERGKNHGESENFIAYLPFNFAPECLFISVIKSNVEEFSKSLSIERDEMDIILSSLMGSEHHDYIIHLSKKLSSHGCDMKKMLEAIFDIWIEVDPDNHAEKTFLSLKEKMLSC